MNNEYLTETYLNETLEIANMLDELKAIYEERKNNIITSMDEANMKEYHTGYRKVKVTRFNRSTVKGADLKAADPELYSKLVNVSETVRFSLK